LGICAVGDKAIGVREGHETTDLVRVVDLESELRFLRLVVKILHFVLQAGED